MTQSCINRSLLLRAQRLVLPRTFCRYKSITAAIERGRSGGSSTPFKPRPRTNQDDGDHREVSSRRGAIQEPLDSLRYGTNRRFREEWPRSRTASSTGRDRVPHRAHARTDLGQGRTRSLQSSDGLVSYSARSQNATDGHSEPWHSRHPDTGGVSRERHRRDYPGISSGSRGSKDVQKMLAKGPDSLPYTTAASEFIYGHSSVLAAIKANRRKFYKLYVHSRGAGRDGFMSQVRAHKLFAITQEVGDEYMRAMDKASSGRPHNGIILESSPLPVLPITELKSASIRNENFGVAVGSQSAEDLSINGNQELWTYKSAGWRYPLVLYVDGVVDEGNLGAIARSAYLLGADAVITPTHHTANWSHIAVKASAGAAEVIPLFKVGEPNEFLGKSSRAGWRIYASSAVPHNLPVASPSADSADSESGKVVYTIARSTKRLAPDYSPVSEHPTILMMGAEGSGLRAGLLNLAHYKVSIPLNHGAKEVGVDSLNVSVASSILCYEMLQKPRVQAKPTMDLF